jgi:hypothetical protein
VCPSSRRALTISDWISCSSSTTTTCAISIPVFPTISGAIRA